MKYLCLLIAVILLATPKPQLPSQTVTVQTKSYIARMVTQKSIDDGRPDAQTTKALGFDDLVGGRVQAYELMLATDLLFREDPPNGNKESGDFRLWSQVKVSGKCQNNKIMEWSVTPLEVAFGTEGPLEAKGEVMTPLKVTPSASGTGPRDSISFRYAIKGRPNALTLPTFENIRPRNCTWIWHDVTGKASCEGNTLVVKPSLTGSGFPSHRLWRNSQLVSMISQGPFDQLWVCSSTDGLVK